MDFDDLTLWIGEKLVIVCGHNQTFKLMDFDDLTSWIGWEVVALRRRN
jgi:hypothetical protein